MKNMVIPTVIEKTYEGERAYDIFSRILKDRIVMLNGEINDHLAQILFLQSEDSKKDITIQINSPGGSITSGMYIFDTMEKSPCDIITIGGGLCASMGSFLLSMGTPGKRMALPNLEIMIHQPLGGAQGQQTDIEITAAHIKRTRSKMEKFYADRSNGKLTPDKVHELCERDNWMYPERALELGLIDKIL